MSEVTVIIPVFNAEQYLGKAIDSVRSQNYTDWNMILVNDGSSDGSLKICEDYSATDSRIHVITQANGGPAKAIRTGIENAFTPWCMFLDADDWYEPEMIQLLHDRAVKSNADCVRVGYQKVNFEGKVQSRPLIVEDINYEEEQIESEILMPYFEKDANIYHHWSAPRWDKIYRTELLKTVVSEMGDNLPKTGEDLLMNLYYLQHCKKVSSIGNAYCYNYRVLDQSLARGYRPQLEEENRKYMTAVVELACKTNRSFHAKSVMEDNNILNLLYELKHTPDMTDAEKKQISKRLKTQLHDQKKAWKLLLYEDFPGKKALRELKHKLTSQ